MDLNKLPVGLPIPIDDGACRHLSGVLLPDLALTTDSGETINMQNFRDLTVIYIFPMIGDPTSSLPENWDQIPGARGCTPQSCAFRDHYNELNHAGADVYGLSTQAPSLLAMAVNRLHLPYPLISDAQLEFTKALKLPSFVINQQVFIKRMTLICRHGIIEKVFYPVFPPDENAALVLQYLNNAALAG